MAYDQRPECPPEAEGWTWEADRRRRELEEQAVDRSAPALTRTESDELERLRATFKAYCAYRGEVDRYLADQKKRRETPPNPADPKNLVGMALRAYHEGKAKPLQAIKNKPRTGLANAERHSTAGKGHGRGLARMADALCRGPGADGLTR